MPEASPHRGVMIALAYLWPLALVPLVLAKDDADLQWHAKHGLVLMAAEVLLLIVISMVATLASLATIGLGCALGMGVVLVWLAILALHAMAIVKGISGGRLFVPWLSEYATRF